MEHNKNSNIRTGTGFLSKKYIFVIWFLNNFEIKTRQQFINRFNKNRKYL